MFNPENNEIIFFFFVTDRIVDETPKEQVIYPDPEIERDVFVSERMQFQSEMFSPEMNQFDNHQPLMDLLNSMRQEQESGQSNANMNFGAFAHFNNLDGGAAGTNPFFANIQSDDSSQKVPETRLQNHLKKKLHIAALSIVTYLLITMASFHCSVFLIFLIWEITEIFLLRQHENNPNGIINLLFMLAGISPTKINIFLKWIQLLNKILCDVAIFVFFFVLTHVGYMSWNGLSLIPATKGGPSGTEQILERTNVFDNGDDDFFEHSDL